MRRSDDHLERPNFGSGIFLPILTETSQHLITAILVSSSSPCLYHRVTYWNIFVPSSFFTLRFAAEIGFLSAGNGSLYLMSTHVSSITEMLSGAIVLCCERRPSNPEIPPTWILTCMHFNVTPLSRSDVFV